jgi:hypothetical protein
MEMMLNIFFSPAKVFEKIKEKPEWLIPMIIVLVVILLSTVITVFLTKDTALAQQEDAMRERGMSDEQIEQAKIFIGGPIAAVLGGVFAVIITVVILLVFSLLINVLIPIFGGASSFKTVFSVVSHAALVRIPSMIVRIILILLTKSLYVSASLALLAPGLGKSSFAYRILAGFDGFVIWEMALVALGISVTNNLSKKNAFILILLIFLVSIFIGAAIGGLGGRPS